MAKGRHKFTGQSPAPIPGHVEGEEQLVIGALATRRQSKGPAVPLEYSAATSQSTPRRTAEDAAVELSRPSRKTARRRPGPIYAPQRGPAATTTEAAKRERDQLVGAFAAALANLDINPPTDGDFSQLTALMCDAFRQESASKKTAESELSRAAADREALKALLATQREELQGLRQQIDNMSEAVRQQRSLAGRQISQLEERYAELLATHNQFRVQADTIYAAFEHLRSTGLTGIWRVFGAALRDQELYDAVVIILTSGLFNEAYFRRQLPSGEIPVGLSPIIYDLRRADRLARDPHPLFSVRYYRAQLPIARRGSNALLDYLQYGHDLAPHPLFMPRYYLEQLPGLANITGVAPLVHYCMASTISAANPHPLFDNAYYAKQVEAEGGQPPANLLVFYLSGQLSVSPHPLFDRAFYQHRYLEHGSSVDPLVHYLTVGDRQGANPHTYFHTRYYRLSNPDAAQDGTAALVHFILKGADENRPPHPMFDLTYYKRANPEIAETGYRLLVHFVAEGEAKGANPHPLIDLAHVKRQLAGREMDSELPFRALLDAANVAWLSPHPLFDIDFYKSRSLGAASYAGGSLLYYLLAGYKLDEPVHPLFDPAFYRAQAEAQGVEIADPLVDFLIGEAALNPHPLFDIDHYAKAGPSFEGNPLLHYLSRGDKRGRDPHPLFDVKFYKRDAGITEDEPALLHYVANAGIAGDPHPIFDTEYYLAGLPMALPAQTPPLVYYLTDGDGDIADPHPLFDQEFYWSLVAEDEQRSRPALLHYLAHGAAAPSPHLLFDVDFFTAGYRGTQPGLVAFLSQFQAMDEAERALHGIDWREANRDFCSLSYLLDHPDLPLGEIPILHYLRSRDDQEPLLGLEGHEAPRGFAFTSRDRQRETLDAQRLIDCVRERSRRDVSKDVRGREEDYRILGDRLVEVEVWSASVASATEITARIANGSRLAIYALELGPGGLQLYHHQMVNALRDAGYVTVIVAGSSDQRALPDDDIDLWVSPTGGGRNDFHTWAAALAYVAPSLASADQLLFLNDNLVGPIGDLQPLLRRLERDPAEIRGLTERLDGERRLQGDFMLVSSDAIVNGALPRMLLAGLEAGGKSQPPEVLISDAWPGADRIAATIGYMDVAEAWLNTIPDQIVWARALPKRLDEFGLSAHLPKAVGRRYADYLEDWLIDRSERVSQGEYFNPQHVFWDALIESGFPFLNKELLLTNPMRVANLIRLGNICARYGDEPSRCALRALAPSNTGFPRSYLRLSEALVDAASAVMA